MLSAEHRLQNLLGLNSSVTKRSQSTAINSSTAAQNTTSLSTPVRSSSFTTMAASFNPSTCLTELTMSSPPITAVPRPLVLRKAKSYAIQSSVDLMAGSPKQSRATGTANIPCKFYKNDACTAGANCPFLHNADPDHATTTLCKYYLKGNCKFGSKCALLHSLLESPTPNIPVSPYKSRLIPIGASVEDVLGLYNWEPSYITELSSLMSEPVSYNEYHDISDICQQGLKESNSTASNETTPNIDILFSSPRTPVSPSVTPMEYYSTSSGKADGFGSATFHLAHGNNHLHSSCPRPSVMSSLMEGSYYSDDCRSVTPSSFTFQDVGIVDDSVLASSLDEILTSSTQRASKPVPVKAIQRPGNMSDLHPLSASYSSLFGSSFTDKLNSIASESHELELTKDILRIRNDRRRASEPTTSTEMKESQELHVSNQLMTMLSGECGRQADNDIEEGPFLMD